MSKIKKIFSKNLKTFRNKRGLTQEQLAEQMGISVRYIQLLEGKSPPNVKIETLDFIAKALKIKAKDLIS